MFQKENRKKNPERFPPLPPHTKIQEVKNKIVAKNEKYKEYKEKYTLPCSTVLPLMCITQTWQWQAVYPYLPSHNGVSLLLHGQFFNWYQCGILTALFC